ncbi:hypothetical protein ACL6C3_13525 [Capilliphycus salinus ALCB114379]|uniref:hypothetical protein n=1 Tax=Capilliphycus salinus TaxID=2768948 RepID=UPI0039A4B13F
MTRQISVTGKEPWLAVIGSTIFPGIGHIYAGGIKVGWMLISIAFILVGVGVWLILSSTGSIRLGLQLLVGYLLLQIWSLFDAYRTTKKFNSFEFERQRKTNKDPWLAVFLSRLIPGLGQAYQGQWGFALLFFIAVFGGEVLAKYFPLFFPVGRGLSYFCLYHAYIHSPTRRKKS